MTIDLSQFVGKNVRVRFQNGGIYCGVIVSGDSSDILPSYKFILTYRGITSRYSYFRDGTHFYQSNEFNIVRIEFMKNDLSQFVGKKVTATFRSGVTITDVLTLRASRNWPYKLGGYTYNKAGYEGSSPNDIVHIELAKSPMTINLLQFVGRRVIATLRNGQVISGTLEARHPVESYDWPYKIGSMTFTADGHHKLMNAPTDIIHIEAEPETMKKYEQLEAQIAKLQEEVERLKKQEREEEQKDELPLRFSREQCLSLLNNPEDTCPLNVAFDWPSTPQGGTYWSNIENNGKRLTDAAIIQIQKWVILSYQQEQGK